MFGTNLFGIGMPELIFIAVIALIVLGPQRLPGVMREVAKFIGQLRSLTNELTSQFSEEIAMLEELDPRKLIDEATKPVNDAVKAFDKKPAKKSSSSKADDKKSDDTATSGSTSNQNAESDEDAPDGEPTNQSERNGDDSQPTDNGADLVEALVEDVAEVDDKKPKPQMQTDPSNVASTEPYKNRTPNLNLIKPRTPKPQADSADDGQSNADQSDAGESNNSQPDGTVATDENKIIPPDMQSTVPNRSVQKQPVPRQPVQNDGATASSLVAGRAVSGNGHKPATTAASSDETMSGNEAADDEPHDVE